jgi:hypothetical protein
MKNNIPSPTTTLALLFLPILCLVTKKRRKAGVIYFLGIILLNSGCFQNFYRTNSTKTVSDSALLKLQAQNKHFTVYLANGNYTLNNIKINDKIIEGDMIPSDDANYKFLRPNHATDKGPNTYKKKDEAFVLNEVQIYATTHTADDTTHLRLPMTKITRVDIFSKNKGETTTNHIVSGIGMGLLLAVFIFVGVAAIACNCPQVYTFNGSEYQFKSGVFSGAIYSSLERTDYLPLDNLVAVNGKYKFRVMNTQREEQNINQIVLMKIPHDPQINVLLDKNGRVHTFQTPVPPSSTTLIRDKSGKTIDERDGRTYLFNEKSDSGSAFGSVILTFPIPAGAKQSKLIVNAKNSMWAGFIFEDFTSLFGGKFQKYQSRQDKANREKLDRWQKEQALSLMVYVETERGWQLVDYFPTTGNTAARDMIMAINIPPTSQNTVRVKLESAFMFWELDYAAMDFSTDRLLQPQFIAASSATISRSSGVELASLASVDDKYCKMLQNDFLSIEFEGKESDQPASFFLVSTGYYHSLEQFNGKPDVGMLKRFKKKGYFSEYSEKRFNEAQEILSKGIDLQGKPAQN